MIIIKVPADHFEERSYIIDIIFNLFLGLEFDIQKCERSGSNPNIEIELRNGNSLVVEDHFFSNFENGRSYLEKNSIPDKPTTINNQFTDHKDLLLIYGNANISITNVCHASDSNFTRITCGADVFASSFFMLSRWEEYVCDVRDRHGRFPLAESFAIKHNLNDRPIVNEYIEMLWSMLRHLCCSQQRKVRSFGIVLSHDVDFPFEYAFSPYLKIGKNFIRNLFKRHDGALALSDLIRGMKVKLGDFSADPYYTFDTIMDTAELHNIKTSFYFIPDHSGGIIDGNYDIEHILLRKLLKHISIRGHQVGLHMSYNSYNDKSQALKEFQKFTSLCKSEKINQESWGGRQHYLRWESPTTFTVLEHAGLNYDSSLGYAESPGFRCGTCFEYPLFDFVNARRLKLIEKPLIVMDTSFLDSTYGKTSTLEHALDAAKTLKDQCRKYNGDFTLLWHNSRLVSKQELSSFNYLLSC